ncbi:MAG: DUF4180 domain-containing protein [Deltaproteobacteria bacterium]|nr:DUF4180 domain-containing protein [Deltaproteobacteria bacterium]
MGISGNYVESRQHIGDTSDLLSLMAEAGSLCSSNLLIHSKHLTEEFFNLKSGVAGEFLQKFSNYSTRVAILLDESRLKHPRFKEMVLEANKQGDIAYFEDHEAGIRWLTGGGQ